MSQENVEIVRRALAATSKHEPDWETVNALYDSDHVLVPATSGLGDGDVRGAAGAKAWYEEQASVTNWDSELRGVLDMGPNLVLAKISLHFRGLASGVEGEQDLWLVIMLKLGKITRTLIFVRPQEAAQAAAEIVE